MTATALERFNALNRWNAANRRAQFSQPCDVREIRRFFPTRFVPGDNATDVAEVRATRRLHALDADGVCAECVKRAEAAA
jgi:hypothetical protein